MEPQSDHQAPQVETAATPVKTARKPRAAAPAASKFGKARNAGAKAAAVAMSAGPSAVSGARASKYAFSLTDNDVALIAALKQRSAGIGPVARKSDIVRAALHLLAMADGDAFAASLHALTPIIRKKKD